MPNKSAKQTREVKKLTIEITDQDALLEAFPEVELVVTQKKVDRQKLRPIVKAFHSVGRQVPGVHAFYAGEDENGKEVSHGE